MADKGISSATPAIQRTLDAVWRIESARIIATLAKMTSDVSLAEDLAQEALIDALTQWAESGVPNNPGAWLTAVAKRKAIDAWRRREKLGERYRAIAHDLTDMAEEHWQPIPDDVLRLVFIACHPVLSREGPVVSLLRDDVGEVVDSVSSDDHAGIRMAVDHLTGLGHRRIIHVDGGAAVSADQRRAAFRIEMLRHGLEPVTVSGGPTEEDGLKAGQSLRADMPSAIVAFNDRSALGIMESLRAAGLQVPSDVSVLGYDDSQFAKLSYVQLSSISQDAPLLAAAAVDRAVSRIEGAEPPTSVVRTPHLVLRRTTARPAPHAAEAAAGPKESKV